MEDRSRRSKKVVSYVEAGSDDDFGFLEDEEEEAHLPSINPKTYDRNSYLSEASDEESNDSDFAKPKVKSKKTVNNKTPPPRKKPVSKDNIIIISDDHDTKNSLLKRKGQLSEEDSPSSKKIQISSEVIEREERVKLLISVGSSVSAKNIKPTHQNTSVQDHTNSPSASDNSTGIATPVRSIKTSPSNKPLPTLKKNVNLPQTLKSPDEGREKVNEDKIDFNPQEKKAQAQKKPIEEQLNADKEEKTVRVDYKPVQLTEKKKEEKKEEQVETEENDEEKEKEENQMKGEFETKVELPKKAEPKSPFSLKIYPKEKITEFNSPKPGFTTALAIATSTPTKKTENETSSPSSLLNTGPQRIRSGLSRNVRVNPLHPKH
eukprot:TRINITY_DN7983_c0_g1_i1.p1 TRINITY_DN7983_c0_g1~~TRINITY_DN7983_c0_g1_i1.p1  ORF type:complete len:376 (-),score=115.99 TRINITY_DN7983_c0_g1_i1:96-1223(-)